MIVDQFTVERVRRGTQRKLWLPLERGSSGELLGCPVEKDEECRLQPAPFAEGISITVDEIKRRKLASMTVADARSLGVSLERAFADWEHHHGDSGTDRELWVVAFTLGRHATARKEMSERYLRAKMGGGRDYTYEPEDAVHGEGAVLHPGELHVLAHDAAQRHHTRGLAPAKIRAEHIQQQIEDLHRQMQEGGVSGREQTRALDRARRAMRELQEKLSAA